MNDITLMQLLQQIIKNPKDDVVRLVYADAIEEQGEYDRAEFIRIQCELVKHPVRNVLNIEYVFIRKGLLHFYSQHERRIQQGRYDLKVLDASKGERKYFDNVLIGCIDADGSGVAYIDEHSIPESDHIKGLREREKELSNLSPLDEYYFKFLPIVNRGFISQITCSAEDFFKHVDTLIWNDKMRVPCPEYKKIFPRGSACKHCGGENKNGYVMNHNGLIKPMPITAQPIERVTLTTLPRECIEQLQLNMLVDSLKGDKPIWRSAKYGKIDFELPSVGTQLATY